MRFTLIVIFILPLKLSFSQVNLTTSFNKTFSGRNFSISLSKIIKQKSEFGLGLRININKLAHNDDQNNLFKNRLYVQSNKPLHYLGLHLYHHIFFTTKSQNIKPFLFYDIQITYAGTRNRTFSPYTYNSNGEVLYIERIDYYGPYCWLETNLGIGFTVDVSKNIYLFQKIGGGIALIMGKDQQVKLNWLNWNFSGLIEIGLGYKLKNHPNKQ